MLLIIGQPRNLDMAKFRLAAEMTPEEHIHDAVSLIELQLAGGGGLEVSLLPVEREQGLPVALDFRRAIRRLDRIVAHLHESRIREDRRPGELINAEVIARLKDQKDAYPVGLGVHLDAHHAEVAF